MQACESYRKALELKPNDMIIIDALNRTAKEILKEQKGIAPFFFRDLSKYFKCLQFIFILLMIDHKGNKSYKF